MNPLRWRREHQLAWVLTTVLAALIGLIIRATISGDTLSVALVIYMTSHYLSGDFSILGLDIVQGITLGAIIGATMFYICMLVRAGNSN